MSQKFKFSVGDHILCYDGQLLYDAKCLKTKETEDKGVLYYIHYVGWNKKWDVWVPEDRVLKYSRTNVQRQIKLRLANAAKTSKSGKTTKPKNTSTKKTIDESSDSDSTDSESDTSVMESDIPNPSMQSEEQVLEHEVKGKILPQTPGQNIEEGEENSPASTSNAVVPANEINELHVNENGEPQTVERIEIKIVIPEELKQCLVDDRYLVCVQKKLVKLPAKPNILEIFTSYLLFKRITCTSGVWKGDASYQMLRGLEDHINAVLGTQLLYSIERQQYEDARKPDSEPLCCTYGGIHLLRLFVRLGKLVSYYNFDQASIRMLVGHFEDLLQYMVTNKSNLFGEEHYEDASEEYLRRLE